MAELRENILRQELQREIDLARDLESQGKGKQAGLHYTKAAALYRRIACISSKYSEDLFNTAQQYEDLGKTIKIISPYTRAESEQAIDNMIVSEKPDVKWDSIGGLEETKKTMKEAIILPLIKNKPPFVESTKTILLYGPPGTGKTLLAKACSNTLNAVFFEARASTLLSKYFGESTKIINTLFSKARKTQPSLIFMDEVDSIVISRESGIDESTRRVVGQLLMEIEGFNTKKEDKILFIAATNKPWDLDDALISRFQRKIYIPLPDLEARKEIFKIHLKGTKLDGISINDLANQTENYSGRDIANLCREAIMHMIREQNPDLCDLTSQQIERYSMKYRTLVSQDFRHAFEKIKPPIDLDTIKKFDNWSSKMG
jgi:SpoVK/Ycf46/Vps4 family AAA+-type ATPase